MTNHEAPHVNGVLELSKTEQYAIKKQLENIKADFAPTYDQPVCDTFYLVVEHTKKHGSQATFTQLNGDTAEFLLN